MCVKEISNQLGMSAEIGLEQIFERRLQINPAQLGESGKYAEGARYVESELICHFDSGSVIH